MRRPSTPSTMFAPAIALVMSGCFLVSGLENDASSSGSTSDTSTTSTLATGTTDTSVSSGQGGANGSSSSGGGGEGGTGGMAPVAYARAFEGLRFETFAMNQGNLYVGGTKDPHVVDIDGHLVSNARTLFVASFSLATGMAQWVKELRSYDDADDPRSISIAVGTDRLIIASATTGGMWIETSEFDGSGLAALATCNNPGAISDFYRNVKIATLDAEIAIAFNSAPRNGMATINCSPSGPMVTFDLTNQAEEVMLFTYDEGFSTILDVSSGNALADSRPAMSYTSLGGTKRIAISFERGGGSPEALLGIAARDALDQMTILTSPFVLGPIFAGIGGVTLGGTDQFALVSGGVRSFAGIGPLTSGSGLLRAKIVADGTLAPAPQKLDHDGLNDAVNAGVLAGDSVRIDGGRAVVAGWSNDAHKLGVTFPPEGVTVGANGQRAMFFGDFDATTFDRIDHAISLPLGPKTLTLQHVVQAALLPDDGIVAAGVIPNLANLCGAPCPAYVGSGERGCAFLVRQPFTELAQNGGAPRVAAGCYLVP